ncbi:MAG: LytTR family transcriptional regulator [Phaeodactylibacter sp.]|nr:LytTR family transcriptional regulator [Phaeodactylibacter sp.]
MKMITFSSDTTPLRPMHTGRKPNAYPGRKVALPTIEGYIFKKVEEVVMLEAEGNYTSLQFADGSQVLVCKTLRYTEKMLAGHPQFFRIHRSYTINLDHLEKYIRGKGGYVVMENGKSVSVSNSRKPHFLKALECYFGSGGMG